MSSINKNKAGLVLGSLFGFWHLTWSLMVAFGLAQSLINWIFYLHFIQPPYTITAFKLSVAVALVAVTSLLGYIFGWLFAAIWNWLHPAD